MTGLLLINNSGFAGLLIEEQFNDAVDIETAGCTRDSMESLEKVKPLSPDVITHRNKYRHGLR
jgi:chemotaxis response regulator CheB